MDLGYDIGDRVIQIEDGVVGKVVKFYPTAAYRQQTTISCDDGMEYHAPSKTFIKVDTLAMAVISAIRNCHPTFMVAAALPAAQEASQPVLVPHDYRDVKVAENTTITVDLEELKRQLVESHYPEFGLNHEARRRRGVKKRGQINNADGSRT
ncbi:hypothetical protein AALA13_05280 [Lachnospiraceae bacterium 50-23]